MKAFIVLATICAFVACTSASHYGAGPGQAESGSSTQFRSEDNHGNYRFGYDETHSSGGSSRREEEHNGVVRGSYTLHDADGRQRTVNYVADHDGFHATVHTNEPGVEPKDPADVLINKEGGVAVAPAPGPLAYAAPAAPVAYAPTAPARLALPAPRPAIYQAPTKTAYAAAPRAIAAPVAVYDTYEQQVVEEPTPRAFSYSFDSSHAAPTFVQHAPVYQQRVHVSAPIYQQQGLKY